MQSLVRKDAAALRPFIRHHSSHTACCKHNTKLDSSGSGGVAGRYRELIRIARLTSCELRVATNVCLRRRPRRPHREAAIRGSVSFFLPRTSRVGRAARGCFASPGLRAARRTGPVDASLQHQAAHDLVRLRCRGHRWSSSDPLPRTWSRTYRRRGSFLDAVRDAQLLVVAASVSCVAWPPYSRR